MNIQVNSTSQLESGEVVIRGHGGEKRSRTHCLVKNRTPLLDDAKGSEYKAARGFFCRKRYGV